MLLGVNRVEKSCDCQVLLAGLRALYFSLGSRAQRRQAQPHAPQKMTSTYLAAPIK